MEDAAGTWQLLIVAPDGVQRIPLEPGSPYDAGAARIHVADGGRVWVEPGGAKSPALLNDVQVSGPAELRSGDQLRAGEWSAIVQQVSPALLPRRGRVWRRADFEWRLHEEAERARGTRRTMGFVLLRSRELAAARARVDQAVRPGELVVWGDLGADAAQAMIADGTAEPARDALTGWAQTPEASKDLRFGWATAPADGSAADELLESALSRLDGGTEQRLPDELLMLDPISLRLRSVVERIAEANLPLLLEGERGTGKAAWAWHAHVRSGRRGGWWRLIDCRHVRDVGSVLFPVVDAGTLVLRHVDALGAQAQRALMERWPQAGGVIATTRGSFGHLREEGALCAEFAARFERTVVPLPALRDRPSEIIPLALQAVQQARAKLRRPRLSLGAEARQALQEYPWPHNVRELRNAIGLAALSVESDEIRPENLPTEVLEHWRGLRAVRAGEDLRNSLKATEKDVLLKVLARTRWNVTAAAKELGLPRRTVVYRMSRLGLRRPGR